LTTYTAACGGGSNAPSATTQPTTPTPTPAAPSKPTIGYLPQGWAIASETYYGQYDNEGEPKKGSMQYISPDGNASLYIEYGELPAAVAENKSNLEGALRELISEKWIPQPDKVATMTFCGRSSAYATFFLSTESLYGISILSINDSAMIVLDALWTAERHSDINSIIGNISYFN